MKKKKNLILIAVLLVALLIIGIFIIREKADKWIYYERFEVTESFKTELENGKHTSSFDPVQVRNDFIESEAKGRPSDYEISIKNESDTLKHYVLNSNGVFSDDISEIVIRKISVSKDNNSELAIWRVEKYLKSQ